MSYSIFKKMLALCGIINLNESSLDNVVKVITDGPTIEGVQYPTFALAEAFIQNQTPSSTNLWVIETGGNKSDAFSVKSWIVPTGILGNTRLTGSITSTLDMGSGPNLYEALIVGAEVANLNPGNGKLISLLNCKIIGGDGTGAFIFCHPFCFFDGGDWSGANLVVLFNANIRSGAFGGALQMIGGVIEENGGATFAGGTFHNVGIGEELGDGNYEIHGGVLLKAMSISGSNREVNFYGGAVSGDITLSNGDGIVNFYGSTIQAAVAPVITAASGDVVNFYGCKGNFTTAGAGTFNFVADRSS